MAITVTTRAGKGSPLTNTEMDTNLTDLARSASTTQEGNIEIATQAEVTAMTDLTRAVVPGYLEEAVQAVIDGQTGLGSLTTEGYYQFASGMLLQWGQVSVAGNNTQVESFPTAFGSTPFIVIASPVQDVGNDMQGWSTFSASTTQFSLRNSDGGTWTFGYFAVGVAP